VFLVKMFAAGAGTQNTSGSKPEIRATSIQNALLCGWQAG
jgi:hypothetical protein